MPESFFIAVGNNRVHVRQFGSGPRLVIAFHGFGESGNSFSLFEPLIRPDFTLYAPDLPLHGDTMWEDKYLNVSDLEQLIGQLLNRHPAPGFSLLGYSMGGRVALALIPSFIDMLECVILAAPDGLNLHPVYTFATRNPIGKLLFRYVTYYPGLFRFIVNYGFRFSLMNQSIYKFIRHNMHDKEVRKLVFGSWNCLKKIQPDMPLVIRLMEKRPLPACLYFGRYDRIFPPQAGERFKTLPAVRIRIAESGHQLITGEIAGDMIGYLREN